MRRVRNSGHDEIGMQQHRLKNIFWIDEVFMKDSYVMVAMSLIRSMICPTISVYKGIVKEKPIPTSAVKLKHIMPRN